MRLAAGAAALAFTHRLTQPPHEHGMPDIPGDARQLARAIGDAGGELGDRVGHGVSPRRGTREICAANDRGSSAADLTWDNQPVLASRRPRYEPSHAAIFLPPTNRR